MARLTLPCHMGMTDTAYRVPISRDNEFRLMDGCIFGQVVDRLGRFEDLGHDPEELEKIISRYKNHKNLFPG